MLSSQVVIEGPPALLLVDASRNLAGWESALADRLATAMVRRGLRLVGARSLRVDGIRLAIMPAPGALKTNSFVTVLISSSRSISASLMPLDNNKPRVPIYSACAFLLSEIRFS